MTLDRSFLAPTPVTDKNGVQAIRWKRPEPAQSANKKIPAVKAIGLPSHWEMLRKDFRPFSKLMLNTTARVVKAKYRRENMVSQLNPETLDVMNARYSDAPKNIASLMEMCIRNEDMLLLNNAASLIEVADEPVFKEDDSMTLYFHCVAGLNKYKASKGLDYSMVSPHEKETSKALMIAAALLEDKYISRTYDWVAESPRFIVKESLEELIRRRPEDCFRIASILEQRELPVDSQHDIEMLENILDESRSSVLGDGAL